jgi:hypothetical protein
MFYGGHPNAYRHPEKRLRLSKFRSLFYSLIRTNKYIQGVSEQTTHLFSDLLAEIEKTMFYEGRL